MNQVQIITRKAEVFDEVAKSTAYLASRAPEAEKQYQRIAIADSDHELLEAFWVQASHDIIELLSPYIIQAQANDDQRKVDINEDLHLTLSLPNNWKPEVLQTPIEQAIKDYATRLILQQWLTNTAPETKDLFKDSIIKSRLRIQFLLYHRQRPIKDA